MNKLLGLLRKLWANEPALITAAAAIAVSEGILTSSQASGVTDLVAALIQAFAAFGIRSQVLPTAKRP